MAGTKNDVMVAKNADFTQINAPNASSSESNGLVTNGKLWIGSTATNAGGTHINVGSLTSPNGSVTVGYSSPNITLQVAGGTTSVTTLTPNEDFDGSSATPVAPQSGTINILGSNPSFATVTETYNTTGVSTGNFDIEHRAWTTGFVVDTSTTPGTRGTFSTLAAAMAAAVSGQTIFLRTSVTENVTLTPGVNITGWSGDSGNIAIIGTLTMTAAGTCNISNINLQTNSVPLLTVSGSAASIVNLRDCYLNCTNNTGISFSSSSASAQVILHNCYGDIGTTGIGLFAHSSAGNLGLFHSNFTNTGASTTASTISAGNVTFHWSRMASPVTSSGTGSIGFFNSIINTSAQNVTSMTFGGSGTNLSMNGYWLSGSASAVSISQTLIAGNITVDSSNTNVITGAGTINYCGIHNTSTTGSYNMNVTTQNVIPMTPSLTVGSANTGATNTLLVTNSSNTASSNALISTTVGGTTANDPYHVWTITGGNSASAGLDNSVSGDPFVLSYSTALGTNNILQGDATGGQYKGYNTSTAPAAGYIGERINSNVSTGAPVALTTATAKTVTSISLTAGIWDVSTICVVNGTLQTRFLSGSSLTDNTLGSGGVGIDTYDTGASATAAAGSTGVVPAYRYSLAGTTTVYLVASCTFTGSANASGRITGVRVA